MSSRILYQDRAAALSDEALVLRGFTKIIGRPRRVELPRIRSFRVRAANEFPSEHLPSWGLDDRGVWYTRDPRRWRRQIAIEVTLTNGETVGFTPAHASRFRDLLLELGVKES